MCPAGCGQVVGPNTKTCPNKACGADVALLREKAGVKAIRAQKASQLPGDAVSSISKAALKAHARCMGLQVVMVTLKPGAKTAQVKGDQRAIHTCMQRLCTSSTSVQMAGNTQPTPPAPCSVRPGRQVGCHGVQVQDDHEQHVQDQQAGVVLA